MGFDWPVDEDDPYADVPPDFRSLARKLDRLAELRAQLRGAMQELPEQLRRFRASAALLGKENDDA